MEDMDNPLSQEIVDIVCRYLVGNVVSKEKDLMESAQEVYNLLSDLEEELNVYFSLIHEANKHFWPALLNPKQDLEIYPEYSTAGTESKMQITLRYIYPAFVETPGAMQLVKERWTKLQRWDFN